MRSIQGSRKHLGVSTAVRGLAFSALLFGLAPAGQAGIITLASGAQTLGGYAESASVQFDINNAAHTITVSLLNLIADPTDVDQALGSVRFTISGAGSPIPSMGLASGTVLDINNGGVIKNVTAETTDAWQTSAMAQGSSETIALCAVCAGGGTTGLIIGGPDASGKYGSADGTLRGSSGAPWIIGSGLTYAGGALAGVDTAPSWVINFASTTDLSTVVINDVTFGFGEAANYGGATFSVTVQQAPQNAPEPDSMILLGTGLGLMAIAVGTRQWLRS